MDMMADCYDSERLRDFDDGWTGRQTEICDARVAFETEKLFEVPFRDCICDGSSV